MRSSQRRRRCYYFWAGVVALVFLLGAGAFFLFQRFPNKPPQSLQEADRKISPAEDVFRTSRHSVFPEAERMPGKISVRMSKIALTPDEEIIGLAGRLKTPEAVSNYLWRHFSFETDQRQFGHNQEWQSPETFLRTQKGDCEDFSLLAYQLLKLNGIRAYILNVYGKRFAHTVCLFKLNGKYRVMNGDRIIKVDADDLHSVMDGIWPFWEKAVIVAVSP